MKHLSTAAAGLALACGLATAAVAPAQASTTTASGATTTRVAAATCSYRATRDTFLYENRSGTVNRGFYKRIGTGTTVSGACYASDGWVRISRIRWTDGWHSVASFQGDKDFMRSRYLRRV